MLARMKISIACLSLMVLVTSAFAQTERQILVTPRAEYPQIAKDSGLGGTVTVYVTVDPAGNVVAIGDVSGPGAVCPSVTRDDVVALRESARNAAASAKFAASDVATATSIPLNFEFPTRKLDASDVEEKHYSAVAHDPGPVSDTGATSAPRDSSGRPVPKQISGGVLNGKAVSLPKPSYPPAARAVRASGAVSIQVLIIEDGTVFSASAVSGHPLLRSAARLAACGAEFSPTRLMGNPVKVSGVITYNFVP